MQTKCNRRSVCPPINDAELDAEDGTSRFSGMPHYRRGVRRVTEFRNGNLLRYLTMARTKIHRSNAARQRAYRKRLKRREHLRYWLTPPDVFKRLNDRYAFDFDACPNPRPPGFDGLAVEWGRSTYVNPPFVVEHGQRVEHWVGKAVEEHRKGKTVVLVLPAFRTSIDFMRHMGLTVLNLGRVKWRAIENPALSRQSPWDIAAYILETRR